MRQQPGESKDRLPREESLVQGDRVSTSRDELPPYVEERLRRPWPAGVPIVEASTPVLSFGDPTVASIATLGLNPSLREFRNAKGDLLTGRKRRLADLEQLGIASLEPASRDSLLAVKAACDSYFQVQPYHWFRPLEQLLLGLDTSYYDGSACHLDLVQWATDPVWSGLPKAQRQALITADSAFLREQLRQENVRLVLANGRTVIDALKAQVPLEVVDTITDGKLTASVVSGEADGVRYVGWTCNLQNQPGALALIPHIQRSLNRVLRPAEEHVLMTNIERKTAVESKAALAALLRRWHNQTNEPTIGDVGSYGGTPWIYVELPSATVVLNADTKRAAVAEYLQACDSHGDDLPWQVTANRSGKVNKVLYGGRDKAPGWYAYTLGVLDAPVTL